MKSRTYTISGSLVIVFAALGSVYFLTTWVAARALTRGDGKTAVKILYPLAELGDVDAQLALGEIFEHGTWTTNPSPEISAEWLHRAADKGNAIAQYEMGRTYFENGFSKADQAWSNAVKWYLKSAMQGYALAQYEVAQCYAQGYCGSKNISEALKWYMKAAEQGDWRSQDEVGRAYFSGNGVKQDYAEADFWRLVADRSRARAGVIVRPYSHYQGTYSEPDSYNSYLPAAQELAVRQRVDIWIKAHPMSIEDDWARRRGR